MEAGLAIKVYSRIISIFSNELVRTCFKAILLETMKREKAMKEEKEPFIGSNDRVGHFSNRRNFLNLIRCHMVDE